MIKLAAIYMRFNQIPALSTKAPRPYLQGSGSL